MIKLLQKYRFILLAVVAAIGLFSFSTNVSAAVIDKTDYQVTTTFKNNNMNVANNGSYGDSRFVITPIFSISDAVDLNIGDQIVYKLPDQLQFDTPIERDMTAPDGMAYAKLKTDSATKTATITITDVNYFNQFSSSKQIGVDLTAVWDKKVMPAGKPQTFNLEGYGDITLTRVVIDEEPLGISKWGVQRSDTPQIIEWRIRVNRDLKTMTNVRVTDVIPANQELVGQVRGHYFADFYNGPNTGFNNSNVTITMPDKNHFTIEPQDLDGRGMFIYYQTRIIGPVDSTNKVYNAVTLETAQRGPVTIQDASAPVTKLGDIAIGEKVVKIPISTKKLLHGRPLKNGEFSFQLVNDANGTIVETVTNDENGNVRFKDITLKTAGTHRYRIVEVNNNVPNVMYDVDNDIQLTFELSDKGTSLSVDKQTIEREAFTNTYTSGVISIPVQKVWQDNNDQDGKRTSVTMKLYEGAQDTGHSVVLTKENNWTANFENVTADRAGVPIVYTVVEEAVDGYQTASVIGNAIDGFVVTNEHTPETIDVEVMKRWEDDNNRDGKRPFAINVQLYQSVDGATPTAVAGKATQLTANQKRDDNTWVMTFTGLPKYEAGKEIKYTVQEDTTTLPAGYTGMANGTIITNQYTPETTDVVVTKRWEDNNNRDGKRPFAINVQLYQSINGGQAMPVAGKTVTLTQANQTDANTWVATLTDLPKYEAGHEITYTVQEDTSTLPAGYTGAVNGTHVTNRYVPETVDITVTKNWQDQNNQDGVRPTSITVKLLANGVEVDRQEVQADAVGKWEAHFTNKPKYENGQLITYTVDEEVVAHYEKQITDFTITNTHVPATVQYEVTKRWSDDNNRDGKRPATITVQLYQAVDGATPTIVAGKTLELTAANQTDDNTWVAVFSDLPKFENGKEIVYSVVEDTTTLPAGYTASVTGQVITNSYTPETIQISGVGTWDDVNNQDGVRPTVVTVEVTNSAGQVVKTQDVVLGANGEMTFAFDQLPKYTNGQEEKYTLTAKAIDSYETTITVDPTNRQYTLVFKHTPVQIPIAGIVVWDDLDNKDQIRPQELQIALLANGVEVAQTTASPATDWKYDFGLFDRFKDAKEVNYTLVARAPQGYAVTIDGFVVNQAHRSSDSISSETKDQTPKTDSNTQNQSTNNQTSVPTNAGTTAKTNDKNAELPNTSTASTLFTTIAAVLFALLGAIILLNNKKRV